VFDSRNQRNMVEGWVKAQPVCPSPKEAQRQFPEVPQKHIRSAVQSRKDREKNA
jgi:hypothetical protein